MAFIKVLKNKAFFKRYQVQKRRRREGKTDFFARRKMIQQAGHKYNSKKYRLIVRFTNRQVICQVAFATILGDKVVAQSSSMELPKYGIKAGLKNHAAAYLTGLLVARRALKKFDLDDTFKGHEELDGEEYHVEDEENDQRPFKCILDVGIRRTVAGARMWGALKGAVDGGLHVPHTTKKFPGYTPAEDKGAEASYDAEAHKSRILGNHLSEYMEMLQEEDPTRYEAQFAKFIENDMEADGLEDLYKEAAGKIREDPDFEKAAKKDVKVTREQGKITDTEGGSYIRDLKLTLEQRKEKVAAKIAAAQARAMSDD
eukprot:CAMPEP_0194488484 /NCGR_PEP_ID=MMETSP0253-20130528/8391_1 /TAXON_ID=2966 /ORGANISM="Noctiluca scintillans" /LENGTH=313 /DNA_ID=CAMNT_0039328859 /DNA_START=46 /DNA_END=987 /DNA_ORIENTATION=-